MRAMTNGSDDPMWPPALWANQFQEAGEDAIEQQTELFRQFLEASTGAGASSANPFEGFSGFDGTSPFGGTGPFASAGPFGGLGTGTATFKTRVQSGGRISIPDAEREALDIDEGDIVQTIVIPLKKGDKE